VAATIDQCVNHDAFDYEKTSPLVIEMINRWFERSGHSEKVHVSTTALALGPVDAKRIIEGLPAGNESLSIVDDPKYVFRERYVRVELFWAIRTGAYFRVANEKGITIAEFTSNDTRICEIMTQIRAGEIYLFGDDMEMTAVIVAPPTEYHVVGERKVLHRTDGPALAFADGSKLFYLNGVKILKENRDLVTCEITEETAKRILSVENVDERAQLIARHGIDKFVAFGELIADDTQKTRSDYQLFDMGPLFESSEKALFLKMDNLSEDFKVHVEGVNNSCTTVQDAIDFRAKTMLDYTGDEHWRPSMVDGVKMYENEKQAQQGDVLLRSWPTKPDGAVLLDHMALRGIDSRHVPTGGKLYRVTDSHEWLEVDSAVILQHPEHNAYAIMESVLVASGQEIDHQTGIVERLKD
jgi:hypothetical protein